MFTTPADVRLAPLRSTITSLRPLLFAYATALFYPALLDAFHQLAASPAPSTLARLSASILLVLTATPSIAGVLAAWRLGRGKPMLSPQAVRARRLTFGCVVAPTLYTFLGVVQAMVSSPLPDEIAWALLWLAFATLYVLVPQRTRIAAGWRPTASFRVVHGVIAVLLMAYVLFHLTNHLSALGGEAVQKVVMAAGRSVYRSPFVEPVLVLALLAQAASG